MNNNNKDKNKNINYIKYYKKEIIRKKNAKKIRIPNPYKHKNKYVRFNPLLLTSVIPKYIPK